MGALDYAFGTSLMGSWFASILCGVAYAQAFAYFKSYPNDSWVRKALVIASILFSLLGLVGAYADVYEPLVSFWGDPAALATETWSVPMYSVANAAEALTVNGYLISRFYFISKNIFVSFILALISVCAFVAAFLVVFLFPGVENFEKVKPVVYVWIIVGVIADVSIALSLVFTLRSMKTSFKETNRLVRRVMVIVIQNGCATSLCAIAGMIATIFKIDTNLAAVFFFLLSPLYVLTLLSNFNMRGSSGASSGSRTWSSSRNAANSSIVINNIHVQRMTTVAVAPTELSEVELSSTKLDEDAAYPNVESMRGNHLISTWT
ncbi:hypothetical protein MSAN_01236100 [Mycena sanguinolenta]|uniref:DUF6534 domain-containing protein n=1 Tax=Mycena sanguinolenta TaxID=230812 RepID=A0A8H6YI34_9AGAR|nr:hypothetical protein MSAN_01236100 [Mycena sanguinolenta]